MPFNLLKALVLIFFLLSNDLSAQISTQWGPDGFVKIEDGLAGLESDIERRDIFGQDHDQIGDVNGDGVIDLVVGSRTDNDGGEANGAVHILFMNDDGTVAFNQKISMLNGGFTGVLAEGNNFGYGVAGIGDYDNDGVPDIAVAAPLIEPAIYILHLNTDGTVKSHVKNENIPCIGLSAVGDLNSDGKIDLVACDPSSDLDGTNIGAIRILFFDANSTVIQAQTKLINPSNGGFGTGLVAGDQFGGREVAVLGDIGDDGTIEMAVGAFMSDGGKGAIWILSLDNTSLDVVSKIKITEGLNGFSEVLSAATNPNGSDGAQFGHALCNAGDLNGDGVTDLMTGANQQSMGYIIYLNADRTVKTFTRINNDQGGFDLELQPGERFSRSISFVGDLRGDGTIAVNYGGGAGGAAGGTVYLLFFKPCEFIEENGYNRWSGGNILFTNWDHSTEVLTGDSLTLEQCNLKAFETGATYITYNSNDGRCICMDSNATLSESIDLSVAYSNECSNLILLPIDLLDPLRAQVQNKSVILSWKTANEIDNAGFEIQKSSDGATWEYLTWLEGQGNSSNITSYVFEDDHPFNGSAYYRLKQIDFDGQFSFSNIASVIFSSDDFAIYPNPVDDVLYFTRLGHGEFQKITLLDINGQVRSIFNTAHNFIDLSGTPSGMYLVKVTIDGVESYQKIIVK